MSNLATGYVLNGRYRIVKLLARGGFGAIYRAWDLSLSRVCAVKENLEISPAAQRQFEQEAKILANLNHPKLPRVTDHFSIPGQGQYLVMDYVEGEDLQEILNRTGRPLQEAQALPWISQVCNALIYLHGQSSPVIHRDIKPANIKITPEGKAMLVDFGIAKMYDPVQRTTAGARGVTPGYSPPEQYGQGNTDARTDIYALGATLYTLLTAQAPPDSVDILSKAALPPRPVQQLNPSVRTETSTAIEYAMQLEPAARFKRVQHFKTALEAAGRDALQVPSPQDRTPASTLQPLTPTTTSGRSSKKKTLWVCSGVLTLLACLCFGGVLYTVWMNSDQVSGLAKTAPSSTPNVTPTSQIAEARLTQTAIQSSTPENQPSEITHTSTPQETIEPKAIDSAVNYKIEQVCNGKTGVEVEVQYPNINPINLNSLHPHFAVKDIAGNWQEQHYAGNISWIDFEVDGIARDDLTEGDWAFTLGTDSGKISLAGKWGNGILQNGKLEYPALILHVDQGCVTKAVLIGGKLEVGLIDTKNSKAIINILIYLQCQAKDIAGNPVADPVCLEQYQKIRPNGLATFFLAPGEYFIHYGSLPYKYEYNIQISPGETKRLIIDQP